MVEALTLSVVVPVYNEGDGLYLLMERLRPMVEGLGVSWEVVFVDDHSADHTPEVLQKICDTNPGFRRLRLARNSGSHIAILAGLENCRGACAVFMAADLQDPPELLPKMLSSWRQGNKIIWAVRVGREGLTISERVFSYLFYWLLRHVGGIQIPPGGYDFAMVDRAVIEALRSSVGANPSLFSEIARLGFRQAEIPYTKQARQYGTSKWTLKVKLKTFADTFVSFSYAPVRMMSYAGLFLSTIGFLYALYVLLMRIIVQKTIPGFASLMVAVLGIGGFQMIMLGVLGEYLWRTLDEARRRPRYFIEDSLESEKTQENS